MNSRRHLHLLVEPPTALPAVFAARVSALAAAAVAARGRFAMAIPGGSVAAVLLPALTDAPIDWACTDIFWCDERAVPPDDPDSNSGAAIAGWLGKQPAALARVHRMAGTDSDLDAAAGAYASDLRAALGSPPILDLVVLGVGEDGHVASLFPGDGALDETLRLVTAVRQAPKPPPRRLTLTLPVIRAARVICLAALGAAKRSVIRSILLDPASDLPVNRALRGTGEAWILFDPAAAPQGSAA